MNVAESVDTQTLLVNIRNLDTEVEVLQSPSSIDCQDVMPGFDLDLTRIL